MTQDLLRALERLRAELDAAGKIMPVSAQAAMLLVQESEARLKRAEQAEARLAKVTEKLMSDLPRDHCPSCATLEAEVEKLMAENLHRKEQAKDDEKKLEYVRDVLAGVRCPRCNDLFRITIPTVND